MTTPSPMPGHTAVDLSRAAPSPPVRSAARAARAITLAIVRDRVRSFVTAHIIDRDPWDSDSVLDLRDRPRITALPHQPTPQSGRTA